jgi:hypothetical protein
MLRERFPGACRPLPVAEPAGTGKGTAGEEGIRIEPGKIVEVVAARPGCGGALWIGEVLRQLAREQRVLGLIDGRDSFDPDSHGAAACRSLFWVRCRDAGEAVQAADWLLRDGNLPELVLDLQLNPERELRELPPGIWRRFRTLAERSGAGMAVLTAGRRVDGACRRFRLEGQYRSGDWDEERARLAGSRSPWRESSAEGGRCGG